MEGIDKLTKAKIESTLRYTDVGNRDRGLLTMFDDWWSARQRAPAWLAKGKDYWKWRWLIEVARVKRIVIRTDLKGKRCPGCGARLLVPHCLACDLQRNKDEAEIT